jgi:hypothetical protein
MQQAIRSMMKIGGLAFTAAVVCNLTLGTAAMACSGPKNAAMGAALSPKVASLRNLGLVQPPRLGGRDQAGAIDAAAAPALADPLNPTIVGLWQVMDLENGKPVDLSFEIWHADGTEVLIDQTPPAEGNVCIGTWFQSGSLTYKLTHPALNFDMNGNFIGTVMIREVVTLDRNGNKFTATFTVDLFDVNGTPAGHFEGQSVGTRINPI